MKSSLVTSSLTQIIYQKIYRKYTSDSTKKYLNNFSPLTIFSQVPSISESIQQCARRASTSRLSQLKKTLFYVNKWESLLSRLLIYKFNSSKKAWMKSHLLLALVIKKRVNNSELSILIRWNKWLRKLSNNYKASS